MRTYQYADSRCFPCRWKLNDMEIDLSKEGSHYSLSGGNLVISNPLRTEHVGTYSCLATNMFGTIVSREASVQFGCKLFEIRALLYWRLGCAAPSRCSTAALELHFYAFYSDQDSKKQLGQMDVTDLPGFLWKIINWLIIELCTKHDVY